MRFEALRETLLRGGIAPRHVRRYLRELEEHYTDLYAAQREAGLREADAAMVARAQLGQDENLAKAMLEQRDFRSLSARFPWLVFGIVPPLTLLFASLVPALLIVLLGFAGGILPPPRTGAMIVPAWYRWAGANLVLVANFVVAPLLAWGWVLMAQRQRMSIAWPIIAILMLLALGLRAVFSVTPDGIGIGLTSILPIFPKGFGPAVLHWPTFLAQGLLLSLPLGWLVVARRRLLAKVPLPS